MASENVDIARSIGARIRLLRIQKNFSQQQLARCVGVTERQIRRYEMGASDLTLPQCASVCRSLGVTISELTSSMFGEEL